VRRVPEPGTDRVALPGSSLEFSPQTAQVINIHVKDIDGQEAYKKIKEPTGRLSIPDLITRSQLNNQPTPEQAGVQRVLKTKNSLRTTVGWVLDFFK
jgi:hypothetical protein